MPGALHGGEMTGRLAARLSLLFVALMILVLASIYLRVKTGKPWSAIVKDADRRSGYILMASLVILLVIFGVFFIVNNGFIASH